MLVLGANAVGLELAQAHARAGTQATVLELLPRIAPLEDDDISTALAEYLDEEGLRVVSGYNRAKVERHDGRYILTGTNNEAEVVFEVEQLSVATGRPATEGLGLEAAGAKLGPRGEILVNDLWQTDTLFVYAAGDVTGRDMFVYTAAYGSTLAAENALTGAGRAYDAWYIPRLAFADPQAASADLTEVQARDTRGLIKLVADAATDRLPGAHILAPEGGEMIQAAVLAIRFGLTVRDLRETMFPYLTNAEALKLPLVAVEKDVTKWTCCAG